MANFNALVLGLKWMDNKGRLNLVASESKIDIKRIRKYMIDESELTKAEQDKLWELQTESIVD